MTQRHGELRDLYPVAGEAFRYRIDEGGGRLLIHLEGAKDGQEISFAVSIESRQSGEGLCRAESGRTHPFAWAWVGQELHLWLDGDLFVFERAERRSRGANDSGGTGDILAPMPGAVLEVLVEAGQQVERNQTVLLLESMKMELAITAPRSGVVRRVAVQPGQQVERGARLVEIEGEG